MKKKGGELSFDGGIYSAEAVKLAAYVFSRRCAVDINGFAGGVKVRFGCEKDRERIAGEFCNEVLNQQCRIDLAKKNYRIASIIVTKALLSASGARVKKGRAGEK